jgi:hypothetical protein
MNRASENTGDARAVSVGNANGQKAIELRTRPNHQEHQPPGRDVVHPGTDISNYSRNLQQPKVQMAKRTPWRVLCDHRWRWRLARATAHRILLGVGSLSACSQVALLRLAGMLVDREFARESGPHKHLSLRIRERQFLLHCSDICRLARWFMSELGQDFVYVAAEDVYRCPAGEG